MASDCSYFETCDICGETKLRFRCKRIYLLSPIREPGDKFKFLIEGGNNTTYETTWELPNICPQGKKLPLEAQTAPSIFISENFMNAATPKIPWSAQGDRKHPGSLDTGDYETKTIVVDRVRVSVVFQPQGAEQNPPPIAVDLDARVALHAPLDFGATGTIELSPELIEQRVKPLYPPGTDLAALVKRPITVVDALLWFAFTEDQSAAVINLFDGRLALWKSGSAVLLPGNEASLPFQKNYLRWARASLSRRAAPPAAAAAPAPPRTDAPIELGFDYAAFAAQLEEMEKTPQAEAAPREALLHLVRGLAQLTAELLRMLEPGK